MGTQCGADPAFHHPAHPFDHAAPFGRQVHEHAAPVDGVVAAVGQP
ncbi:hypothetical protein ACFQV8_12025 [Pseudonocardia benzenivorans]